YKIDQNILDVFEDLGLTVDIIQEESQPISYNDYKFIFAGDENFRRSIPVNSYPSIITSYYHADTWGLSDNEGVSQLGSTHPLSVLINGGSYQVYTQAMNQQRVAIPYYYLDKDNKGPAMNQSAGTEATQSGRKFGDVISYAYPGSLMENGRTQQARLCFYGIIESDFWTQNARDLFEDCIGFVASECELDSDCGTDKTSDPFCIDSDIFETETSYTCENPGTIQAQCVEDEDDNLLEECPIDCADGECIGECETDADCDDQNNDTQDTCHDPATPTSYCTNDPITCHINEDCGIDGLIGQLYCTDLDIFQDYESYTCLNPGTAESSCTSDVTPQLQESCPDACVNGECKDIICYTDPDCDDADITTGDVCHFPGTVESFCSNDPLPVTCSLNEECGTDALTGDKYCINDDVYQDFLSFSCLEPGTIFSSCADSTQPQLIEECAEACVDGECVPITCRQDSDCGEKTEFGEAWCSDQDIIQDFLVHECLNPGLPTSECSESISTEVQETCHDLCIQAECQTVECNEDSECEDYNPLTFDICSNPGTVISECQNIPLNCASDTDCGYTGFLGQEFCSRNNVYKNYRTAICHNPGELESHCDLDVVSNLISECANVCIDGTCIACHQDSDCDDADSLTIDTCHYPSTPESYCSNDPIKVECGYDSDCGTNQWLDGDYCIDLDIFRDYKTYTCLFPGTSISECTFEVNPILQEQCADTCIDGSCEDITCYQDSDCGTNQWLDGDYCIDLDIFRDYKTYTCNNPSTPESYCSSDIDSILKETCAEVCVDGNCEDIPCYQDSDCGSNRFVGDDFCTGDDVFRNYKEFTCHNPGTAQASCSNDIFPVLEEECADTCIDGSCEDITCCTDSECGSDGFIGQEFCIGDNIYQNYKEFLCLLPSTPESYCTSDTDPQLIDKCDYACTAGICIRCDEDSDCDDEDSATTDNCLLPGTELSHCENDYPVCSDKCTDSSRRCRLDGYQICHDYDGDGCTEWSGISRCSSGNTCSNGYCENSCTNQCTNGERRCSDSGYQVCRDYDGDGCTEWSGRISCSYSQTCTDGYCI
ncbi:MAG: hypothetical protein ACTSWQ_08510, partial [Candidatus Thorarchaeota archaeon]